jgi:hypothetical protein
MVVVEMVEAAMVAAGTAVGGKVEVEMVVVGS